MMRQRETDDGLGFGETHVSPDRGPSSRRVIFVVSHGAPDDMTKAEVAEIATWQALRRAASAGIKSLALPADLTGEAHQQTETVAAAMIRAVLDIRAINLPIPTSITISVCIHSRPERRAQEITSFARALGLDA